MTDDVSFGRSLLRGLRRHCPECDAPGLFEGYLRVRPRCPRCGADHGQHRVDDVASYFTVLLVGHLIVAPLVVVPALWSMPLWAAMGLVMLFVTVTTLTALPFIKGGVVGALSANARKQPA